MKIGCRSVHFRQLPLEEALNRIRRAGFEYLEIGANLSQCNHADCENNDPYEFRKLVLEKYGFKGITGMASHRELIHDSLAVRDLTFNIQWAREAGIPVVISAEGSKPDEMKDEDAWAIFKRKTNRD